MNYYYPEVSKLAEPYPFGSLMPGRNYSSGDYRYGFGGQEKDDEVSGSGNSYTAEFWQYSPRLGRRFNIDPVYYGWKSPYEAFNGNPILYADPSGADADKRAKRKAEKYAKKNGGDVHKIEGGYSVDKGVKGEDGSFGIEAKVFKSKSYAKQMGEMIGGWLRAADNWLPGLQISGSSDGSESVARKVGRYFKVIGYVDLNSDFWEGLNIALSKVESGPKSSRTERNEEATHQRNTGKGNKPKEEMFSNDLPEDGNLNDKVTSEDTQNEADNRNKQYHKVYIPAETYRSPVDIASEGAIKDIYQHDNGFWVTDKGGTLRMARPDEVEKYSKKYSRDERSRK